MEAAVTGSSMIRKMFEQGAELRKKFGADKVFDFSIGNPDLPPPPKAIDVLNDIAAQANQPRAFGYCPNAGLPDVREKLATLLGKEQACDAIEMKHVLMTVGAAGGLVSFFRAVLEPGDEILVPSPYFVEYTSYIGHFGGKLVPVPMQEPDFALNADALAEKVTDKTRVILINTPNNPTGAIYGKQELQALATLMEKINAGRERPVFLVSDEPYRLLRYDGIDVPPVLPVSPYAVVVGSYSKSLSLAGERIGYLLVNPAMPEADKMIAALTVTIRTLGFVNAPVIGQRLVGALCHEGVDVDIYDRRRKAMADILTSAGLSFTMPKGAFYFFVKVPSGGDDVAFTQHLVTENILAVPGRGFGCEGYFRVAFCMDETIIRNSKEAWARAMATK